MSKLKQFNFKIPEDLYNRLSATAKAKDVKMTDLIIQGIQQVLGVAATSSSFGVDLDIYQLIDKINERLGTLEKNHVDTATKVHQLIPRLENRLEELSSGNISGNIVNDIYERVFEKIQEENAETLQVHAATENVLGVDSSKDTDIDKQASKTSELKILSSVEENILANPAQLEFITLEGDEKFSRIQANAKRIDSSEVLQKLQAEEPSRNWNRNLLVSYRTLDKYQGKWHQAGEFYFKYDGQERRKGSKMSKHFWLISQT